jgi:hypothetical protein
MQSDSIGLPFNLSIDVREPAWRIIHTIPQDTLIPKGRKNDTYRAITNEAGDIQERFGCYAWGTDSEIFYCGSFSADYSKKRFKSNFHGRVHNYLQNHRTKASGLKNTNLMVFDNINCLLKVSPVTLYLLKFSTLSIYGTLVDFPTYTNDSALVQAVEQLLICLYHRHSQCQWNRTIAPDG